MLVLFLIATEDVEALRGHVETTGRQLGLIQLDVGILGRQAENLDAAPEVDEVLLLVREHAVGVLDARERHLIVLLARSFAAASWCRRDRELFGTCLVDAHPSGATGIHLAF